MAFLEKDLKTRKELYIAGVDEVGRGPLAGPVVSCACFFKDDFKKLLSSMGSLQALGVTDSKKLTAKKRKTILKELGVNIEGVEFSSPTQFKIADAKFTFCLKEITAGQIDEINILQASLLSMTEALDDLNLLGSDCLIWIDGNKIPKGLEEHPKKEALVKGDSRSLLIGLASIIAKEKRDLLMENLAKAYPGYGFEKHAGYPTKFHKEAIRKLGVCEIHRKTFKGVKEFVSGRSV